MNKQNNGTEQPSLSMHNERGRGDMEQVRNGGQTMPEKLVWSVREAGHALGLSSWTIRRYIKTGKLTAVRLNRRVFVEPAECRRFIEQNRKPAKSAYDQCNGRETNTDEVRL